MNSKRNTFKLTQFTAYIAVLSIICSFFSISVFATTNNYQLNKVAQLNNAQVDSSNWQQLIPNPSKKQQHFIINTTGQIYFVDNGVNPYRILDLSVDKQKEHFPIKLTAMELHPNFSLRDQPGYGVFYTAHHEALDQDSSTKRIQETNNNLTLKFDAVITEWQFSTANDEKVDLSTKREVLRIALPDSSMTIKQMSFSPHIKLWNEGFGLLYVTLNGNKKWQQPLYSGVILRINPAKFGLRSFTVPTSNPYIQNSEIKDEIYLLGGQEIKQFMWPDKSSEKILLSHQYNNKSLLSVTSGRDDWRNNPPKEKLYQGDYVIEDALVYRGRSLPALRNKLLLLTKKNQQWLIESLDLNLSVNKDEMIENTPKQKWQFSNQQLVVNNDIMLSENRDGEVLLLDKSAGMIFQISQEKPAIKPQKVKQQPATVVTKTKTEPIKESIYSAYAIIAVLIFFGVVFYFYQRNKFSAKAVVRKQFAHIELSESQQQVGLYHRHQKSTDTIIDLANIITCEVQLNEQVINVINTETEHNFDDKKAQELRDVFAKEQVHKMVEGKVRQVNLAFIDQQNKKYTICLYMRKGSDRITKKSYSSVINDVIDWCWLIAKKINLEEAKARHEKTLVSSGLTTDVSQHSQDAKSLHHQASVTPPVTSAAIKNPVSTDTHKQQTALADKVKEQGEIEVPRQKSTVDTELVDALEKLVNLKQQGFLTDQEFTQAKKNLLQGLFNK